MFRATLLLLSLAGCHAAVPVSPPATPNVIVILADDVGVEAFGSYGGTSYRTPRLDRLAAGGMRFTHVYSQTLCTPSRVKLLTGQGNLRNYVHFGVLDPRERTFGHLARDAGYATMVVGKWQLLGAEQGDWVGRGTHPQDAGFDRWCAWHLEKLGSRYWNPTMEVDGDLREELAGSYGPDLFCDYLLDFVAEHRDEPFLAYYPMVLMHKPFRRAPESPDGQRSKQEYFADMIEHMDRIIGRIEDGLEELGLRERTLLLFVSDNGTSQSIRSKMGDREIVGGKDLSTDAGTHVPLITSWPGTIMPGGVCEDLVDLSDFLPTLAEVIGVELPPEPILDGRSFLPQLLGRPGDPREVLTIYSNPRPGEGRDARVRFARDHRYKLYDDGRFYDTAGDPEEQVPLAGDDGLDPETKAIRDAEVLLVVVGEDRDDHRVAAPELLLHLQRAEEVRARGDADAETQLAAASFWAIRIASPSSTLITLVQGVQIDDRRE